MAGYLSVLYGLLLLLQYQGMLAGCPASGMISCLLPWGAFHLPMGNGHRRIFSGRLSGQFFPGAILSAANQLIAQRKNIDRLAEFNQLIIHHLDMGLITLDSREYILSINPAGEAILGQATSRLKSRPVPEILPGLAADSRMAQTGPGGTI